jgi:hypothetical protein
LYSYVLQELFKRGRGWKGKGREEREREGKDNCNWSYLLHIYNLSTRNP